MWVKIGEKIREFLEKKFGKKIGENVGEKLGKCWKIRENVGKLGKNKEKVWEKLGGKIRKIF